MVGPVTYHVYILSNDAGSVLYTGVTNDLARRVSEHKEKVVPGFTSKYNVNRLVYYETVDDAMSAIEREKQIKGGSRAKKLALIKGLNPLWDDLYLKL
jgi:putative endonuclease